MASALIAIFALCKLSLFSGSTGFQISRILTTILTLTYLGDLITRLDLADIRSEFF